jgi:signal transduction histidine kinase
MQSLGVLGAGAAFGFNELIGTILDHTDEALAELSDAHAPTRAPSPARGAQGALRAIDLAVQLRDYARADRATMRPIASPTSCSSDRAHLEAIAGPAIELRTRPRDARPHGPANPLELRQLLFNLVINAGEAIRPTSGQIRVQTGSLWADPELLALGRGAPELAEGLYTLLSVSDTGPGSTRTTARALFDPFYTTKFAGRGLGLASALGVVRRHGGWIGAGNDRNRSRRALPGAVARRRNWTDSATGLRYVERVIHRRRERRGGSERVRGHPVDAAPEREIEPAEARESRRSRRRRRCAP